MNAHRSPIQLNHAGKRKASYEPLLLALVALIAGVIIDRYFAVPKVAWLTASLVFAVLWFSLKRSIHVGAVSCTSLILIFCFGGLRHHVHWHEFPDDEVSQFVTNPSQMVCVNAIAISESRWVPPRAPHPMDNFDSLGYSVILIEINELRHGDRWVPASGQCRVGISGPCPQVFAGDQLRIHARASIIATPSNPGEFDAHRHSRGKRRLCRLRVDSQDAIEVTEKGTWISANHLISRLRYRFNHSLNEHLDKNNAPLAAAILLGYREQLERAQREQFLLTGTVHLLAISGLHVGILAGLLLWLGKAGMLPTKLTLIGVVLFVVFYAWLVEFRPPVTRAALLISLYCIAKWYGRSAFSLNTLAAAGLIVFALNPADLFNIGAQLSFLAVSSLAVWKHWMVSTEPKDPLEQLIHRSRPWIERIFYKALLVARNWFVVSLLIWLASAVLVAHHFHLVSPAAMICNPLLVLPITGSLVGGFFVLISDLLFPPLVPAFAMLCDGSLSVIQAIVDWGQSIPFGSWWTAGPSTEMTACFYLGLVLFAIYPPTRLCKRWILAAAALWLVAVIGRDLVDQDQDRFQITFADVGHGSATIMELPNGRTVLYDAGSAGSRDRTGERICQSLWHRRISRIDAIVVSHADIDHFNAIPFIAKRFPIGVVLVSQPMLESRSAAIVELFRVLDEHDIAVKVVHTGDQLFVDPELECRVLHPGSQSAGVGDNSDSVVLSIRYRDKSILLPGDLESVGLIALMTQAKGPWNVALAPHHGSANSLPREFMSWAQCEHIVLSAQWDKLDHELWNSIASDQCTVWKTGELGAITFRFTSDEVEVIPFRDQSDYE